MRPFLVATATILTVLVLVIAPLPAPAAQPGPDHPAAGDEEALPPGEPFAPRQHTTGRFHGTGLAHGSNESLGFVTTNITQNWTLLDGQAVVATVQAAAYQVVCHEGSATVVHSNGSTAQHRCSLLHGHDAPTLSVAVHGDQGAPYLDTHVEIDETNSTTYALAQAPSPPNPWPGVIVTLLAVTFAAAAGILAWLYVSERRISRYLVRRLFEETRGHVPKEWPEHLRRRVIARFVVGGKN